MIFLLVFSSAISYILVMFFVGKKKVIHFPAMIAVLIVLPVMALLGCEGKSEETVKAPEPKIVLEDKRDSDNVAANENQGDLVFEIETTNNDDTEEEKAEDVISESEEETESSEEDKSEEEKPEENADGDNTEEVTSDEQGDTQIIEATPGSVQPVGLNAAWQYADYSKINSGSAKLYTAAGNRKNVVIGVNAGHGTKGGQSAKTYCHPDMSPKVTGGSTAAGSTTAAAVSGGMSFADGTSEASVTLRMAQILRDRLLSEGYDVLMLRDDSDVQLDNVARTVIANNTCRCHIALHWDGDSLGYDKGCFYISTPDGIKNMAPVSAHWQEHEALGQALIAGLQGQGCKIYKNGKMAVDLTQTSYSTIPSVDIELGNQSSAHDDATLSNLAGGIVRGIESLY